MASSKRLRSDERKQKVIEKWKNNHGCKAQLMEDSQMKYLMYCFHILPENSVTLH